MEGQSESYNQTWLGSKKVGFINKFLSLNPAVGRHFDKRQLKDNDMIVPNDVCADEDAFGNVENQRLNGMVELSRKSLSSAMLNYWIRGELVERNEVNKFFFGPYYSGLGKNSYTTYQSTVEQYLYHVESSRISEIYEHKSCTPQCRKRGCGTLWSADGLWKLSYPICMMKVAGGLSHDLSGYIPMVCSNSPAPSKAFCLSHCDEVMKLGYPTDLKEFLKSCGNRNQHVDPDHYSKTMKERVDEELHYIAKKLDVRSSIQTRSGSDAQGTSYFLRHAEFRNSNNFQLKDTMMILATRIQDLW